MFKIAELLNLIDRAEPLASFKRRFKSRRQDSSLFQLSECPINLQSPSLPRNLCQGKEIFLATAGSRESKVHRSGWARRNASLVLTKVRDKRDKLSRNDESSCASIIFLFYCFFFFFFPLAVRPIHSLLSNQCKCTECR